VSLSRDDIAAFHSRRRHPTDRLMHRIRIVDASDGDIADTLVDLHRLTYFNAAPLPQFKLGAWWLAYHGDEPVASPMSSRQHTFEMAPAAPGT